MNINIRMKTRERSLFKVYTFFLLFFVSFYSTASEQKNAVFVDAHWLSKHALDENLLIVDVRTEKEYLQGHIPSAVNISVSDTFKQKKPRNMIGGLQQIQALFSEKGVTHEQTILIYADKEMKDAGRVFWVFEVFGHQRVKILNGGLAAWEKVTGNKVTQLPTKNKVSHYVPTVEPDKLVSLLTMNLATKQTGKPSIIDVRTQNEYLGKESKAKRFGHIPNAINIPAKSNFVDVDGVTLLKPMTELQLMYQNYSGRIITYCNRGKDAALTYAVLRALGKNVSVYDGSWLEWGNDMKLPIEK